MKKTDNLLLSTIMLASFVLPSQVSAQTADEAKETALSFMTQKRGGAVNLSTVNIGKSIAKVKGKGGTAADNGGVYAFNAEEGGYCVVCAGNGNTLVAGYSDKGSIDPTNMPDAMKVWLAQYREAMTATDATTEPHWEGKTVAPVAPMLKTQWNQGAPYNSKCPSNGTKTVVAGCVPVALAQVLNYYHQDRKGDGKLEYADVESETEYNIDYSTTTYDWNNMLNTYDGVNATKTQKDAVGKLIFEAAVASKAKFGYDETSAYLPFVALNRYYNYECMYVERDLHYYVDMVRSSDYYISTDKWMSMIQDEMEAGRPIIYSASDVSGGYIVKPARNHAFVIDGIDEKNYVHVNWGWGGVADGYYDVAILNPGGTFNYEQGYRCQHSMIIGIQPRTTDWQEACYQPFHVCDWAASRGDAVKAPQHNAKAAPARASESIVTSKSNMYYFMVTNTYDSKKRNIITVLANNGHIVTNLTSGVYQLDIKGWPDITRYNLSNSFKKVPQGVADGVYELRMAYYDKDNKPQLCPMPKQLIPTLEIVNEGTGMIIRGLEGEDLVKTLTIEDVTPASEIYAGTRFYLNVKASGASQNTYLQFRNVDTGKLYGTSGSSSVSFNFVYNNYTATTAFKFEPKNVDNNFTMPAGRYQVLVPEGQTKVVMGKDIYIDVAEKPNYPILDGTDLVYAYDGLVMDNDELNCKTFENEYYLDGFSPALKYANKNTSPVTLRIYAVNQDTKEERLLTVIENWTVGTTIPYNNRLYPLTGNYEFKCRYLTPDGERAGLMPRDFYGKPSYWRYELKNNLKTPNMKLISCKMTSNNAPAKAAYADDTQYTANLQFDLKYHYPYNREDGEEISRKAVVKAIFYDKEKGEMVADSVTNVILQQNVTQTITLTPMLSKNAKYNGTLFFNEEDYNNGQYYTFVVTPDEKNIADFTVDSEGFTGIGSVSTSDQVFEIGETLKVYGLNGVLVTTTTVTYDLWPRLLSTLPQGVFVLISGTKTIKFRK